ncbi:serine/threonine-protein kinase [Nonomuraea sp. NPDC052634]|uniref:serine/threonine-protein kinase n=1 Tax=Nonomuraea sp. NPDC052634 TaxID=3155813 RepID=UPI003441ABFB
MSLTPLTHDDPTHIGAYALARRVGAGGQGVVYEAYDPAGVRVAIKVLHPGGIRRPPAKEVAAARRVSSFSTAKILEVDLDAERPYIVSEFVDGPSLRAAVAQAGPYEGDALHRLAIGIATAMAAIHGAGVVHRDLKPENVLLAPDGPRVIDFGIARVLEASSTMTSGLAGTPAYMAPELFRGETTPRPAADVYAWGMIMVFAATGRVLFQRNNMAATIHEALTAEPDLDGVPDSLRPLVAKALSKDPDERPPAPDLLLSLVGFGSAGVVEPPAGLEQRTPELGEIAEDLYLSLSEDEQAALPLAMLRLYGADGEPRTVDLADLGPMPALDRLVERGLLVREGGSMRPASAALVHGWPRLRGWLAAERPGHAVHLRISEAAREWEANGHKDGDLLGGSSLDAATRWAAEPHPYITLNVREKRFLDASMRAAGRRARRRRATVITLATMLAISLALAGVAQTQRAIAEERRVEADKRRDEAVALNVATRANDLRQSDPATAMKLSVAAYAMAPRVETRSALLASSTQTETKVFSPPSVDVHAFSGDGGTEAVLLGQEVQIWDTVKGTLKRTFRVEGVNPEDSELQLSADGGVLLIKPIREGETQVWNAEAGERLDPPAKTMSLGWQGRYLVDGDGRTYDLPSLTEVRSPHLEAAIKGSKVRVTRVGATREDVAVIDLSKQKVEELNGPVPAAMNKTGTLIGVATGETVAVASISGDTPPKVGTLPEHMGPSGDGGLVLPVFDPTGTVLATASNWAVQLWDVKSMTALRQFSYPGFAPTHLVFRDGGDTLMVGGLDGSVRMLDVGWFTRPSSLLTAAGTPNGLVRGAVFSPDGRTLATITGDAIRLWDPATRRQHGGDIKGKWNVQWQGLNATTITRPPLAFSPDGTTIATARDLLTVSLIDVATAKEKRTRALPKDPDSVSEVLSVAFSPDGRRLAIATSDWRVMILDADTLRTVAQAGTPGELLATVVEWDPNGHVVALGSPTETRLWEVGSGDSSAASPAAVRKPGNPMAREHSSEPLAFSRDGRLLIVRGENECACATQIGPEVDARVWVWDMERRTPVNPPLAGHTMPAYAAAFSPDESMIATVSADSTLRLWDAADHRPVGLPIDRHRHEALALSFSPDGKSITTVGADSSIRTLRLDEAEVTAAVCARAGGGLTEAEWARHIPEVPYRRTC